MINLTVWGMETDVNAWITAWFRVLFAEQLHPTYSERRTQWRNGK